MVIVAFSLDHALGRTVKKAKGKKAGQSRKRECLQEGGR
jgi:hypothetical protein